MMQFPATNFHDLNLDWMLQQIKTMLAEWSEMQTDFTTLQGNFDGLQGNFNTLEAEWETEKAWMHNYVQTNLPTEVQTIFDAFIETQTFAQIVADGISDTLVTTTITNWLEANITTDPGYVLDASLTEPLQAAPAKTTGDRLNDITEGKYPIPRNLASGVAIDEGTRGVFIAWDNGTVVQNSQTYPRLTKATGLIDISGCTSVVYTRLYTRFAGTAKWGMAFYQADGTTFISSQQSVKNQETDYYQFTKIDVPTYTVEGDDTPIPAKYMRFTLKYELDQIPVVYDGAEFDSSLYGYIEETRSTMNTNDTAFQANLDYLNKFYNQFNFPYADDLPLDICHRGLADADYPENTIVAFKDAIEHGFKSLETDIRFTSDGVCVLLHDATINRTAKNADGSTIESDVAIADITYAQALQYDFGIAKGSQFAGTKIPTLEEFIRLCKMAHVYPVIEIKDSSFSNTLLQSALDIVDKYDMSWRCMWICASSGRTHGTALYYIATTPKYDHVCLGLTSNSTWTWTDLETATGAVEARYLQTGKNKVFMDRIYTGFVADDTHTAQEIQQNFIDYCHKFGLFAGTYSPTTENGIKNLVGTFDAVTTQYLKYDEVQANSVPNAPTP